MALEKLKVLEEERNPTRVQKLEAFIEVLQYIGEHLASVQGDREAEERMGIASRLVGLGY